MWAAPEIVHTDEKTGLRIARFYEPDDTATLGKLMGHCAGHHQLLVCKMRVWSFFSVVDEKDAPHTTIHTRHVDPPTPQQFAEAVKKWPDAKCYSSYQPSERYFRMYDFNCWQAVAVMVDDKGALATEPSEKYSPEWYTWRSSNPRLEGQIPMAIDGIPSVILSADVRGQYYNGNNDYTRVTQEWYEANKLDTEPVTWNRHVGWR